MVCHSELLHYDNLTGVATLRFRKNGVDLNVAEITPKTMLNALD
jgi:hypothetical protein